MNENQKNKPKTKQESFCPPYCPNHQCKNHTEPIDKFWVKRGSVKIKKYPGFNCRYQCKNCHKWFSYTSFKLDYRRQSDPFESIFKLSTQGMSNRSIARYLNISEHKIRECLKVLARQALLKTELMTKDLKIEEPVAYDGFETFTKSQYDPNNINHLVGKDSLFVYDFNFSHMNRKGKMTEYQKLKLKKIEKKYGRYPSNRIRVKTKNIFSRMLKIKKENINLFTDEHKSYELVLKKDLSNTPINHFVTNSKECRNSKNPLFPVNHLDMKLRHFLKSCTRETIAFNKNEAGLMDRVILFLTSKNFMMPKFIKEKKGCKKESPSMLVGISDKIMKFKDFFLNKLTSHQVKLRNDWIELFTRQFEGSRYKIKAYDGV